MLRLEKGRSKEVNIVLNRPVRFSDKLFWKAFLCAFGMHLIALSLFHIHNIIFSNETILAPVVVEIDRNLLLSDTEGKVSAHIEEVRSFRHALAPRPTSPDLPNFQQEIPPLKLETLARRETINPLDLRGTTPFFLSEEIKTKELERGFFVSGPIAEIGLKAPEMSPPSSSSSIYTYEVRVDGKTGRIFWYTPKESYENATATQQAETFLRSLQFETKGSHFALEGEISIVIRT